MQLIRQFTLRTRLAVALLAWILCGSSALHGQTVREQITLEQRSVVRSLLLESRFWDGFEIGRAEKVKLIAKKLEERHAGATGNSDAQVATQITRDLEGLRVAEDKMKLMLGVKFRADFEESAAYALQKEFSLDELRSLTEFLSSSAARKLRQSQEAELSNSERELIHKFGGSPLGRKAGRFNSILKSVGNESLNATLKTIQVEFEKDRETEAAPAKP